MARTVSQIKAQLYAELVNQQSLGNLTDLTSPSMAALYKCWFFIQAVAIAFEEQIQDALKASFDLKATQVPYRTQAWIQAKTFEFQYGDVLAIDTTLINMYYPVIDPAKKIINACSVTVTPNGVTNIKVATGSPLGALSTPQLTALKGYEATILGSGVQINVISGVADILTIAGIVYINGQDPNVGTNVFTALLNYMSLIPFNGTIKVTDIEEIIRGVDTVTDWKPSQISVSPNTAPTVDLISSASGVTTLNARSFATVAGYVQTDGNLPNSLTFTVSQ